MNLALSTCTSLSGGRWGLDRDGTATDTVDSGKTPELRK